MHQQSIPDRRFCIFSGLSGAIGVILLGLSFALANGPAPGTSSADMVTFAQLHGTAILGGAWLQAVGPVFIVLFAFALVHLAGATARLAGWMTFFGAATLMIVSLIEITFYIAALFPDPQPMMPISNNLIDAVQHLCFIVAAPALFLPLRIVLIRSRILPRVFGYLAIVLAAVFAVLGMAFLNRLILPDPVTAFAAIQALWWFAAAVTLIIRRGFGRPK